jgi:hypothetical protein
MITEVESVTDELIRALHTRNVLLLFLLNFYGIFQLNEFLNVRNILLTGKEEKEDEKFSKEFSFS